MAKDRKRRPAKASLWRNLRRNKSQVFFWILGFLVVLSMIVSLVVVALPRPEPPTPTPTPAALRAVPESAFPRVLVVLPAFGTPAGA